MFRGRTSVYWKRRAGIRHGRKLAARLQRAELRPADKPGIVQIYLIVFQFGIARQRTCGSTGLRENQLSGCRIPFEGVRRTHIIIHAALGQHAELVGTALLDDFEIRMLKAQPIDVLLRLGRLVRTRDGHAQMVVVRLPP